MRFLAALWVFLLACGAVQTQPCTPVGGVPCAQNFRIQGTLSGSPTITTPTINGGTLTNPSISGLTGLSISLPGTNGLYPLAPAPNWAPITHQDKLGGAFLTNSPNTNTPQYHNIVRGDSNPTFFAEQDGARDDDNTQINYYQLTGTLTPGDVIGIDWWHGATAIPHPTNSGFSFLSAVNRTVVGASRTKLQDYGGSAELIVVQQ